MPLTNLN